MSALAGVNGLPGLTPVVLSCRTKVSRRRTAVLAKKHSRETKRKNARAVTSKSCASSQSSAASPSAWPSPAKYCKFNVCLPFPGSSMVERSAVNRNVGSSNLPRGANLSSCLTNHLRKIRVGPNCLRKVQMSEFSFYGRISPSSFCFSSIRSRMRRDVGCSPDKILFACSSRIFQFRIGLSNSSMPPNDLGATYRLPYSKTTVCGHQ